MGKQDFNIPQFDKPTRMSTFSNTIYYYEYHALFLRFTCLQHYNFSPYSSGEPMRP
ncbi:MAG: hypothetical protein O2984_06270 [Bacteroidetes bacterium]|nr:hypothetical protein [Bacteroidota bacterium]MDP4587230.1 hypothetical protein [Flavobacteriales bacterium]